MTITPVKGDPALADGGGGLVFAHHCHGWGGWVFEIGAVNQGTNISFSNNRFSYCSCG